MFLIFTSYLKKLNFTFPLKFTLELRPRSELFQTEESKALRRSVGRNEQRRFLTQSFCNLLYRDACVQFLQGMKTALLRKLLQTSSDSTCITGHKEHILLLINELFYSNFRFIGNLSAQNSHIPPLLPEKSFLYYYLPLMWDICYN